jgi:hypothetical protein
VYGIRWKRVNTVSKYCQQILSANFDITVLQKQQVIELKSRLAIDLEFMESAGSESILSANTVSKYCQQILSANFDITVLQKQQVNG